MRDSPKTICSIQYLRALAAVLVMGAHIGWTGPLWGSQGVDIFFIISGFIMMHVSRRESAPAAFLLARVLRVVPLYWVATFAWVLIHPKLSISHIVLSLAFVPHLGPEGQIWPVVWQGWTMLFEAFFYGAFAASLLLSRPIRLPVLTLALGILSSIGWTIGGNGPAAQVYLNPIMLEFVLGAWLHVAWQYKWQYKWLTRPVFGCVAIVSGLFAFIALRDVDPENWRVFVWGIPSLLVVGGALFLEGSIPRVAPLLLLGDASYAIYLFHRFIVGPVHLFAVPALWKPPVFVALVTVGVSVGVAVHLLVERPMTSVLGRLRPKAAPRPDATPFNAAP